MSSESWFTNALSILRQGQPLVIATVIGPASHPRFGQHLIVDTMGNLDPGGDPLSVADFGSWTKAVRAAFDGRLALLKSFQLADPDSGSKEAEAKVFMTWCGPPSEAWVFGAGHISQALSPILSRLGWRVIVCDDRPEFLTPSRFPDAHVRRAGDFAAAAEACALRPDVWAVLVTRGHQHDEQILRALRSSKACYIGMIGSLRRVGTVRKRLVAEGVSPSFLKSLHAPIGLPIGAGSPMEIAVAIAGEMISVRRAATVGLALEGIELMGPADSNGQLELWEHVAPVLYSGKPAVLATVISRRGSTPRGLCAQMAVFADGSTQGTVGGGCGEGAVLRAAKEMIIRGESRQLVEVDLTGDPASETADVCGGSYSVFLELLN